MSNFSGMDVKLNQVDKPLEQCTDERSLANGVVKVKCILGPLLVLVNGLAHLMSHDCLYSGHCHLYLYLDPAFSLVTVVILLSTASDYLKRYGILLLQGVPAHIRLESLAERILKLPGVLAIHELHVWQLSESYTVASVHIHCFTASQTWLWKSKSFSAVWESTAPLCSPNSPPDCHKQSKCRVCASWPVGRSVSKSCVASDGRRRRKQDHFLEKS
ncbi:hypothetical protein HHUSO_G9009 [Huso huso]|uniref:Cation efflux protein cytoplasmic domain-containing protein n=1 Tax=Huso huso TaxID=61971 RepID=A0ABR0ZSF2_HUSHU